MQFGFRQMMFIALLLGMVAGAYALVVRPHAQERERRLADIRSMDAAILAIGNSTDGLDDLAQHINQQQLATTFFRSRLPKEADIEKAINEVIQTAAANSLQPGEVRMLKCEQTDEIGARPVLIKLSGNFNGFYSFLLQIEAMPRVMRITALNLESASDQKGQIQAELTLMMYFDSTEARVQCPHPAASVADPLDGGEAAAARQVVTNYLRGGQYHLAELQSTLRHTDRVMQQCLAGPDAGQVSLLKLRSDPFRAGLPVPTAASDAAQLHENAGDRVAMLKTIGKLQLQSIVSSGDRAACMIDNQLYHEGEQIDGFTIEQIGQREVVVRNAGYRFELKIAG